MGRKTTDMTRDIAEMRDHIADFDDFLRPLRNYFYWEPHCYDIPVCWTMRSVFDTLDGIDILTADIQELVPDLQRLDTLLPQMVALLPENRSEERSVGKECVSTCRSRWSPEH